MSVSVDRVLQPSAFARAAVPLTAGGGRLLQPALFVASVFGGLAVLVGAAGLCVSGPSGR